MLTPQNHNSCWIRNTGTRLTKAFLLFVAVVLLSSVSGSQENNEDEVPNKTTTAKPTKNNPDTESFPEKEWGTYYDPKKHFCGDSDCYKILGFNFETWGKNPPSIKDITQSYRKLSRRWHPDKNKDKGAKGRFVRINKAYEVLTDSSLRKEYDHLRERPDEYYKKYGSSVLYSYAPKSDTLFVVAILLFIGCVFTWFVQKQRWQQVADKVIRDAVEGLKAHEGGSTESIAAREKAEKRLEKEKEEEQEKEGNEDDSSPNCIKKPNEKVKAKGKQTKKEIRDLQKEELRPYIIDAVKEYKDFGAGFHQPTWRDLLIVRMSFWPFYIVIGIFWECKYYFRRLRKIELSDEEREILTKRSVGTVVWLSASDQDRKEMVKRELWVMANLEEWQEVLEVRQLSSGDQKRYNRMKKKEKKQSIKND